MSSNERDRNVARHASFRRGGLRWRQLSTDPRPEPSSRRPPARSRAGRSQRHLDLSRPAAVQRAQRLKKLVAEIALENDLIHEGACCSAPTHTQSPSRHTPFTEPPAPPTTY